MRVVLDTNIIVSGFLWSGKPKEVLQLAKSDAIAIYCNQEIVEEVERVLSYQKFKRMLSQINKTPRDIANEFLEIAVFIPPVTLKEPSGIEDPTDEKFLACAVAAGAPCIISGDNHLLHLKTFRGIEIVSAGTLLRRFKKK